MIKHIKWPSIEQFRNVCKNVTHRAQYVGKDESGEVIMNRAAIKPTLKFEGTVKLHGTNSAVCLSPTGEMWFQSRENIITPEKDNAGFAMFATANSDAFNDILVDVSRGDPRTAVVFGEWCGQGIQKGVAISELPKMFVIFGIALVDDDGTKIYLTREQVEWVCEDNKKYLGSQIKCIYHFPTYEMIIDFENPHESQNHLNEITEAVEAECPVGKALGVSGVGEGVVWHCVEEGWEDSGYWFKVKGDKHSKSKVTTLATVDVERINNIKELADRLAHNGRLEQMHQQVFDTLNGGETDMTKMGDFIKAVMADVFKEDIDIIAASGFTGKEISQPVFNICRKFIAEKL
jgi:hypothetical protein